MTTIQTADGRLLRAQRPQNLNGLGLGGGWFPPMWSDGSTDTDAAADAYLKSYDAIYRSQPVLAGVVDKLTRRIATLPLQAYKQTPDGSGEPTTGDSLDTLLRTPMPRRTSVHLVAHIIQSLLIHGNAVVAKLRGADRDIPPLWLWPLNWPTLNAYGEPGGTIEWWGTTQFGVERFLRAEDTIHVAWPGTDGGELGISPLEKLGVTIALEDAAQRHQKSMFRNGVRPSAVVSMDDPNPKTEKLEYARQRVEAAAKGMDKSGSWLFMGANVKVAPLAMTPVEAALIDQRKLSREEIGMVYDLPGPLMGDFEHATFANVTEMLRSLYRDVIPPWTELIVKTLQAQLIDPEPAWMGMYARFDFSDKLKGDPGEQATVDKSDVEAGIRTRDEARRSRGLPPKGGVADELTIATNNQGLLSTLEEPEEPPESPANAGLVPRAMVEAMQQQPSDRPSERDAE